MFRITKEYITEPCDEAYVQLEGCVNMGDARTRIAFHPSVPRSTPKGPKVSGNDLGWLPSHHSRRVAKALFKKKLQRNDP